MPQVVASAAQLNETRAGVQMRGKVVAGDLKKAEFEWAKIYLEIFKIIKRALKNFFSKAVHKSYF